MKMVPSNVRKYKKTTECDKSTVTGDVSIAQSDDDTIKCEKKNEGTTECDKSTITCNYVKLVLHNMKIISSNVMF